MPQSLNSVVFFETTKVCVASRAFEWPATNQCLATHAHRATHERPPAYDVASNHERAATGEAAGTYEIANSPKIRVLKGQMITLDIWRTRKRCCYAN